MNITVTSAAALVMLFIKARCSLNCTINLTFTHAADIQKSN